jgi:hypothetical protein
MPSDRQATQGAGSGDHHRPEGRLRTAGRTRGPVPGHRGHPRRVSHRPKPAVDVLGGASEPSGDPGTGATRRGHTEVGPSGERTDPRTSYAISPATPARLLQAEACRRHEGGTSEPSGDSPSPAGSRGRTEVRRWPPVSGGSQSGRPRRQRRAVGAGRSPHRPRGGCRRTVRRPAGRCRQPPPRRSREPAAGWTRGRSQDRGGGASRPVQTEACGGHGDSATEPSGDSPVQAGGPGRTEVRPRSGRSGRRANRATRMATPRASHRPKPMIHARKKPSDRRATTGREPAGRGRTEVRLRSSRPEPGVGRGAPPVVPRAERGRSPRARRWRYRRTIGRKRVQAGWLEPHRSAVGPAGSSRTEVRSGRRAGPATGSRPRHRKDPGR